MERQKKSPVWNYFGIAQDDSSKAVCVLCNGIVTRGGNLPSNFTTSNMRRHLEKHHPKELDETNEISGTQRNMTLLAEAIASSDSTTTTCKSSRSQATGNAGHYSVSHTRYKLLTRQILDMFILDCQPFTMVDEPGFRNLLKVADPRYHMPSSSHFSTTELTASYDDKVRDVLQFLAQATVHRKSVALTWDIWHKQAAESFQSLTVHVLDYSFTRYSNILDTSFVTEQTTSAQTADAIKTALQFWNIPLNKIVTFVRDDSPNITSACKSEKWPTIDCMWHCLQFAVHDSLRQSDYIEECLAKCHGIVDYFKTSTFACHLLQAKQKELNIPVIEFNPDVDPQWNSSMEMVTRLVEQRDALEETLAQADCVHDLSDFNWLTLKQLAELLAPIHELCRNLEADDASLGMVIPGLTLLEDRLDVGQEEEQNDVEVVRTYLKKVLKDRFQAINTQQLYLSSTVLDPRFKMEGFPRNYTAAIARKMVASKLQQLPSTKVKTEPPEKVKKVDQKSLWARMPSDDTGSLSLGNELEIYLSLPRCAIDTNVFAWWNLHQLQFPNLSMLAREVLCVPPASSNSERLFGKTARMKPPTRCSLDLQIVKKIAFLKKNRLVPSTYVERGYAGSDITMHGSGDDNKNKLLLL